MLNKTELLKFTTGRVIDLVSNDVQRLEDHAVMMGFFGFLPTPTYYSGITCVFHRLASSHGGHMPCFAHTIFRWVVLRLCCTAPEDNSVFRQPHIFFEPGYFWDSRHQNTCIGR